MHQNGSKQTPQPKSSSRISGEPSIIEIRSRRYFSNEVGQIQICQNLVMLIWTMLRKSAVGSLNLQPNSSKMRFRWCKNESRQRIRRRASKSLTSWKRYTPSQKMARDSFTAPIQSTKASGCQMTWSGLQVNWSICPRSSICSTLKKSNFSSRCTSQCLESMTAAASSVQENSLTTSRKRHSRFVLKGSRRPLTCKPSRTNSRPKLRHRGSYLLQSRHQQSRTQ